MAVIEEIPEVADESVNAVQDNTDGGDADEPEVDVAESNVSEHRQAESDNAEMIENEKQKARVNGAAGEGDEASQLLDINSPLNINNNDQDSVDIPQQVTENRKTHEKSHSDYTHFKAGLCIGLSMVMAMTMTMLKDIWKEAKNKHHVDEPDNAKDGEREAKKEDIVKSEEVNDNVEKDDKVVELSDLNSLAINDRGMVERPQKEMEIPKFNKDSQSDEPCIKTVTAVDTPYTSAKTFEDLNLSSELLRGLYTEMGFEKPSKIQAITLPMILTPPYLNLIAQAHNGSGKTTCFALGILSRIDPKLSAPQALCVCPTRELAIQNQEVVLKMGKHTGIISVCAVSTDAGSYVTTSRRGVVTEQVVIGTPGTVKKWISNKVLSTRYIKILVFDEADHMLAQDGFQDDSLRVMKAIQKHSNNCQILLFSATFDDNVKTFITRMIPNANQVFVKQEDLCLDVIRQYRVKCPDELGKIQVLKDRIFPLAEKLGQSIIFLRSRESASMLHRKLEAEGYKCTSIQGGLMMEERDRVIKEFRLGLTKILISTDILARGFDQAQVTLVVNFDLPVQRHASHEPDYEVYLHRIGRSGRFGRKGAAFNFLVTPLDEQNMNKIERHFQRHATEVPWDSEGAFENILKDAGLA